MGQDGAFHVNGASFYDDDGNDISDDLGSVKTTTVILTDAQIKGLPNDTITLVQAPGLGKALLFLGAYFQGHFDSPTTYIGVDTNSTIGIDNVQINMAVLPSAAIPGNTSYTDWAIYIPPGVASVSDGVMSINPASWWENLPFRMFMNQDDTGDDLTGGDPANTLQVTVIYCVIDVS
jgi:hypothetical protein